MDKQFILTEIKRTAAANGGVPLGVRAFLSETGIKQTGWYGKYWVRWGDALREAGFQPNQMRARYEDDELLAKLASFVREIGQFPVRGDLLLKARSDKTFPADSTFRRLGPKTKLADRTAEYCRRVGGFDDVVALCAGPFRAREQGSAR
jgi:hypothetical protein